MADEVAWEKLTNKQILAVGRIFAKVHQVHGVPLVLTAEPSGMGLGHHSMGQGLKCPAP